LKAAGISPETVSAVMTRALAWVVDYIDEFDPFKNGRAFDVAHGQRVTELATMLNSYVALTGDRDSPEVRRLVSEALRHQQNRALTDRIMHSPAEFVLFADLYAALKRLGHDDPQQRELIQRVIDAGFLDQVERVPHRMMDVRLTLEWGDFRHPWDSLEALSLTSILPHEPRALHLDESSLYSLTHVIMFLYGFGTRLDATSPLSDEQRRRFLRTLSMLLVTSAQEHHWDLLCELLLCWDCLRFPPTPLYWTAWAALLHEQRPEGAFPGPERALAFSDFTREADPVKQRELYFAHHYHTTLVAVIAGAVHGTREDLREDAAGRGCVSTTSVPLAAAEPVPRVRTGVFQRAHAWLDTQLTTCAAGSSSERHAHRERACLELLIGAFVCSEILADPNPVRRAAEQVARALNRDTENEATQNATPPALAIMGAAILRREQWPVAGLTQRVARFADVLGRFQPADPEDDLEWCEKRVLLHQLGLHHALVPLPRERLLAFAHTISASSDFPLIEQLAVRVESFTLFGTAPVHLRPEEMWLPELLIGFAAHRFREYEFRRAARLLRAACALMEPGHRMLTQCRDFLMLHQDMQGAFGFFGPAQEEVVRCAPPGYSFDRDLRLPVTIDCLWALAECDGWRLFPSLPKMEAGSVTASSR
jgi:hypothetical protein